MNIEEKNQFSKSFMRSFRQTLSYSKVGNGTEQEKTKKLTEVQRVKVIQ